jgi:hypothetical protein
MDLFMKLFVSMPQELFKKTVGPLREVFMVYNSQGKSKGMAIVMFQRPADAAVAQKKYHGKIVDARMWPMFPTVVLLPC